MRRSTATLNALRLLAGLLVAGILLLVPALGNAQDVEPQERLPDQPLPAKVVIERVYRMNQAHMLEGMRSKVEASRKAHREDRVARRKRGAKATGAAPRVAPPVEVAGTVAPRLARPSAAAQTNVAPVNVRANNPSGDIASATQAELSLAAYGDQVVVSWNDGAGFTTGGPDVQGFALSSDYGATLTDGRELPSPAGYAQARWRGDPVVAVDEKLERFYVAGMADLDRNEAYPTAPDSCALFIARYYSRDRWRWSTTSVARAMLSTNYFLDKEWIAADSATGNVYLIYTLYDDYAPASIQFQRSTDTGLGWSTAITLSSGADAGDVQGARVACGPNGEVHVVWMHNNATTGLYDIRYRRSTDGGYSFAAQQTVTSFVPLGGTGAPGFNRARGIDMPSLAVDRTTGQYRGRVYVGFSEAYNYLDDTWPSQPPASTVRFETENNNHLNRANTFTAGQTLRGTAGPSDTDYWRVSLTAGQHLIAWFDSTSLTNGYTFTMSAYVADSTERVAYGTGGVNAALDQVDCIYTTYAPYTGLYYLRVSASYTGKAYRVRTKIGGTSGGRGRDRRDPFVSSAQDGTGGWSTPVRATDAPVGSDDFLPEVTVGPDGYPYLIWFDARSDSYMSDTHIYTTRSNDGGASWLANTRLSDASSSFNQSQSNTTPNMGDYLGLAASSTRIHAAWADGRGLDVDAWTASFQADANFISCHTPPTVPVLGSVQLVPVFQNRHLFYADQYTYSWTDERGWIPPESGTFSLLAGESVVRPITVTVPANATEGLTDRVCLTVRSGSGAMERSCCVNVTVSGSLVAVEEGATEFAFPPAMPNPARGSTAMRYGLPRAGRVTLAVFDVTGACVRTLLDEDQRAGSYSQVWDGRDDAGHPVPAGIYFSRLMHDGRRAEQRVVMLK